MTPIWPAMALAGLGTVLIRMSFFALAGRIDHVSPALERVLRMIPPSALAALAAGPILRPGGELDLAGPRLAAGLVALAVGLRTKAVVPTLVAGMLAVALLENL